MIFLALLILAYLIAFCVYLVADITNLCREQLEEAECSGCQRHFVKPGCPVHDEAQRRAA